MSAVEPVRLRYAGGEVYAAPTEDRHVWRVAGVEVFAETVWGILGTSTVAVETEWDLASAALRVAARAAPAAKRAAKAAKAKGRGRR